MVILAPHFTARLVYILVYRSLMNLFLSKCILSRSGVVILGKLVSYSVQSQRFADWARALRARLWDFVGCSRVAPPRP